MNYTTKIFAIVLGILLSSHVDAYPRQQAVAHKGRSTPRIWIIPNFGFESELAAAFVKEQVPAVVVENPTTAADYDYVLRSTRGNAISASSSVSITLTQNGRNTIVWAATCPLPNPASDAPSAAEVCARALKAWLTGSQTENKESHSGEKSGQTSTAPFVRGTARQNMPQGSGAETGNASQQNVRNQGMQPGPFFFYETGNSLLRKCQDEESRPKDFERTMDYGWCLGYIAAVIDTSATIQTSVASALNKPVPPMFCVPEGGIEIGQANKVIIKWLAANPEKLHYPAHSLVIEALRTAFPCP